MKELVDAMSLFQARLGESQTSEEFRDLRDASAYEPARRLMDRVFADYPGPRREFANDFQGRGFSARVWELCLFAWLAEREVPLEIGRGAPDLLVGGDSGKVAIEATTSNPPIGKAETTSDALARIEDALHQGRAPLAPEDAGTARGEMVIQMAKAIRRKLHHRDANGRHYWERPPIAGNPFVVALMAFHDRTALHFGVSALTEYLYGVSHTATRDAFGNLRIDPEPLSEHQFEERSIPSGLFRQDGGENLSAVIFSNKSTVSQFQRIAIEHGLGREDVRVLHEGLAFDPDPNADMPRRFAYEVERGVHRETFAHGIHVVHNPWASTPVPPDALPGAIHLFLSEDGQVVNIGPDFQPFMSMTLIFGIGDSSGTA